MVVEQKSRYKDIYKNNSDSSDTTIVENNSQNTKIIEIINYSHTSGHNIYYAPNYLCIFYKLRADRSKEYYYTGRGDFISEIRRRIILKPGEKLIVFLECYRDSAIMNAFDIVYNIIED